MAAKRELAAQAKKLASLSAYAQYHAKIGGNCPFMPPSAPGIRRGRTRRTPSRHAALMRIPVRELVAGAEPPRAIAHDPPVLQTLAGGRTTVSTPFE